MSLVNRFAMVPPTADVKRSVFHRDFSHRFTFDSGYIIPFFADEVLPGDTFNLSTAMVIRLTSPLKTPIMDNLHVSTSFFFVPNRLVWDHWVNMNGEQKDPGDSVDYLVPYVKAGDGFAEGSIFDYMGIPTKVPIKDGDVMALPFLGYELIYDEWYRDQNLISSAMPGRGDGPYTADQFPLQRRAKFHDYFTSALPWPQKGPQVTLPLGEYARVRTVFTGEAGMTVTEHGGVWRSDEYPQAQMRWVRAESGNLPGSNESQPIGTKIWPFTTNNDGWGTQSMYSNNYDPQEVTIDNRGFVPSNLVADLSGATAVSVNDLRNAFAVQRFYEVDARSGSRYTEILRGHFGVISPDARLQRPEYLGGSTDLLSVTQSVQTSSSSDTSTPQGNLVAYGHSGRVMHGFTRSFVEHGWVIGLINVRSDLSYQQGINRKYSRRRRIDYFWPEFQNLGEQAILNKEIFVDGSAADDAVFGYQERYGEYRYHESIVSGKMRSNATGTLDSWHLSQNFSTRPALNKDFVEDHSPVDRVVAVPSEPQFVADVYFDYKCTRPMGMFSVPGLGGRM